MPEAVVSLGADEAKDEYAVEEVVEEEATEVDDSEDVALTESGGVLVVVTVDAVDVLEAILLGLASLSMLVVTVVAKWDWVGAVVTDGVADRVDEEVVDAEDD